MSREALSVTLLDVFLFLLTLSSAKPKEIQFLKQIELLWEAKVSKHRLSYLSPCDWASPEDTKYHKTNEEIPLTPHTKYLNKIALLIFRDAHIFNT